MLTVNTDKKSNNTSIILNKNNYSKRSSKKTLSKQTKKRSPKINNSIKETFFSHNKIDINKNISNDKAKFGNSRNELKEKKDKNRFLKFPIKTKTIDEWENENIINKSINENDLSKSKSINSDDNNNNHSILKTFKNDNISSLPSNENDNNSHKLYFVTNNNELSSKSK